MKHASACCNAMRQAFEIANKIGDLTYAGYSRVALNSLLIAAGDPLVEVQNEAENSLNLGQKAKFGLVSDMITTQLQFIRTLRGLTTTFGSFDHGEFEEIAFERHLASHPAMASAECWYWIRKLQARFFACDSASAVEASLKARPLLSASPAFDVAEYELYSALAHAACCDSETADQSREHLDALEVHHKQLQIWADNCPENFENRAALVGAEIARIEGREPDAERLYEQAIRSARANGFVHNEALAYEVAGRFYAARGFETFADAYLRNARNCYDRWGATGKVRQLEAKYPQLRAQELRAQAASSSLPSTIGPPHLDVETVVKASQALSSDILLPSLIEKLDHHSLNNASFDPVYVLMGHALPEEAQSDPAQRAGDAQTGVRSQVSNRGETAYASGSVSFGFTGWPE
jgi:tetratricopeptide (TPR) repeat protein